MSAAKDLLQKYQHIVEELALVPGTAGIFDVEVDGEMLYSKYAENDRHAEPGEVLERFTQKYAAGVLSYGS